MLCYVNPPVAHPIASPQGIGVMTIRPEVREGDACASWAADQSTLTVAK